MNPKRTVMLVDDEIQILNSLKRILVNQGYEIILCSSPLEALDLLKIRKVNLIVSDY